jgi:hypothetical protein
MSIIPIETLKTSDLPVVLEDLQRFFQRHQFNPLIQNIFLTPQQLAERWAMPVGVADKLFKRTTRAGSNLNHWRSVGYGPVFAKLGPDLRAKVRYPVFGEGGVLSFEHQNHYESTITARNKPKQNQSINVEQAALTS